jgi:hypothetical protein
MYYYLLFIYKHFFSPLLILRRAGRGRSQQQSIKRPKRQKHKRWAAGWRPRPVAYALTAGYNVYGVGLVQSILYGSYLQNSDERRSASSTNQLVQSSRGQSFSALTPFLP